MAASAETIEWLARTAMFAPLSEADRRAVADEMRETSFVLRVRLFSAAETRAAKSISSREAESRLSILTAEGRGAVVRPRRARHRIRRDRHARRRPAHRRRHRGQQGSGPDAVQGRLPTSGQIAAADDRGGDQVSLPGACARPTSSSRPSRSTRSKFGSPASSWPPRAKRARETPTGWPSISTCPRASWPC